MFRGLRIFGMKGLKEASLDSLGRVNVICGRNSSGKSTVLQAINTYGARSWSKRLDERELQVIQDTMIDKTQFVNRRKPELELRLMAIVREAARQQGDWCSLDSAVFGQLVTGLEKQEPILKWSSRTGNPAEDGYRRAFLEGSTVLIPAKRHLPTQVAVATGENPEPGGNGLINYLFYAKNQLEGASDLGLCRAIAHAFEQISSGYRFDVQVGKKNDLTLFFAHVDGDWIPADDSGLGLHELITILYFAIHPSCRVILIEEPESHIHPEMQKRLLHFLREGTDKQYFLSTHSNVFLTSALVDRVFFTRFTDQVVVDDYTSRAQMLSELGYSVADNLVSDLVILVEGPKDVPVIEEFLTKMRLYGTYDIKIWPLGGDIMDQVDLSVFAQSYNIVALVDKDPGSSHVRKRFMKTCEDNGIAVTQLERYAIENYFSLRALRAVFGSQIDESISEIKPDTRLEDQIGMNVKNNSQRLAREMNLDEIKGTDLYGFLESVEKMCKSAS